jgi:hypothetical protein
MSFTKRNQHRIVPTTKQRWAQGQAGWKFLTWLSIALVAFLTALLGLGYYLVKDKTSDTNERASKEEIEQVVSDLNGRFTYATISKSSIALVDENGKSLGDERTAQYVVSIQDKYIGEVSIFEAKQYVMSILGDSLKVKDAASICDAIDKTLRENDPILTALQDAQIKAQVSLALWGVVEVGVEFTPSKVWLIEIAAAIRRVLGIKAKKIEVLIKGYADGQLGPWKERLHPNYYYDTIHAYVPLEPNRLNRFEFVRKEVPKRVQEYYGNNDLPDLRARFVKEEFIGIFMKHCRSKAETEVHILEGQADLTNVIEPPNRKVQIFINLY